MILALAGGVGGAKLAKGLADVLDPDELMIVVNTGDDFEHLGLHVSPDVDTVMYTLAGINNPTLGWGIAGETWNFMTALEALGGETWFRLGDRDLATNVERTRRLLAGEPLSQITAHLAARLGIRHHLVPMSDAPVRTLVHTTDGVLAFQDYFVRQRAEPAVVEIEYAGASQARMAEGFASTLRNEELQAIVICPSNPYLSVAPMLAIPDVKRMLASRRAPVIAVSPIVGGKALKGPAAKIMHELGQEPSVVEVARFYAGLIDLLVIDKADARLAPAIVALGIRVEVTDTVMKQAEDRVRLGRHVVELGRMLKVSMVTSP
jgi:LPPG:FO 2-phospho-L-lactate transferase